MAVEAKESKQMHTVHIPLNINVIVSVSFPVNSVHK